MAFNNSDKNCVLTINAGSSSIKFALYKIEKTLTKVLSGKIEGIGTKNTKLSFSNAASNQKNSVDVEALGHVAAASFLIDWLEKQDDFVAIKAIGHRIVYGMKRTVPEPVTPALLEEFKEISSYDPEHMPGAIQLIEGFSVRYPTLTQIACFDTAFHASMPQVAKILPIPRRFQAMGIQRYGFHGLSYAWLMEELERVAGRKTAQGRVILAHLGNGASLAAVKNGTSLDTSMGFTPTSGLPMGTRTGDLDPGVAWYLMQTEKLSPEEFSQLINHKSGLLGISETSADMRELIECRGTDTRAAEAIELFCYQTKKWIGAYAAALGGLDTLIFSGGIGEHQQEIRKHICEGLQFLGIEWDETKNLQHEAIISTPKSKVCVRVIQTNEELMIARMVCKCLNYAIKN
jgi:acetate kinase